MKKLALALDLVIVVAGFGGMAHALLLGRRGSGVSATATAIQLLYSPGNPLLVSAGVPLRVR